MESVILQMCPFSPHLEHALTSRFEVHRWFEVTDPARFLENSGPAISAIATGGHVGVSNDVIKALPKLGLIAINGVGFDKVDLPLCAQRGVRVTTTPGALTEDVADLAVGLIISLLRGIPAADLHVRSGAWPNGERPLGRKVSGRTFGIVGLGHIGGAIAQRLAAFGAVLYHSRKPKDVPYEYVDTLSALAQRADVLVLALSANASTRQLIDQAVLEALGPSGYLVNVARGSVVDERALINALRQKAIAGAALDVYADEPRVPSDLIELESTVLTPHIASASVETREKMAGIVVSNLEAYFSGGALFGAVG